MIDAAVPLTGASVAVADKGREGEAGRDAMRARFSARSEARGDDGRCLEEEWPPRVFAIVAELEIEKSQRFEDEEDLSDFEGRGTGIFGMWY